MTIIYLSLRGIQKRHFVKQSIKRLNEFEPITYCHKSMNFGKCTCIVVLFNTMYVWTVLSQFHSLAGPTYYKSLCPSSGP